VRPVAAAEAVHFTEQAEGFGRQLEGDGVPLFVGFEGGVQMPPGINTPVGDTEFLHLFQVEQPATVSESVQGHDPHRRPVRVENGKGKHGALLG
jgi:hypothetical protein